ncbi:hypothetical protein A3860_17325 [Niastella vici]|uniref:Uncharacterized protein n=1 Tax=Niastella vici TaxID=1703345 RepID=A0A1V9G451_9BACT|nr:hypothetical protein [Niastella vici]OQP65425.1 hypothetical protein A3860_17325 [Niastella vici]
MIRLIATFFFLIGTFSFINLFSQSSDVFVNGYFRKDGSYVQPHFRTAPNSSMFDNYSTKGNFNPYTGKPGWIEPFSKVSSSSYQAIPNNYQSNFDNLFNYLNKKDSYHYFKIVDGFDYEYKLFYTGLFKLNNNEHKEAYNIFDTLRKIKGTNSFIHEESNFWFEISSQYLDAQKEFEDIYTSSAKYEEDGNYEVLEMKLNKVKNPLNFYHKYLIKYTTAWHCHKYQEAKTCLDSLIVYSSQTEVHDTLLANYDAIVENLNNMQNTLDTHLNGTYYYPLESLVENLRYYLINKKSPSDQLKKAAFYLRNIECTIEDTTFTRSLNDTSNAKTKVAKIDYLTFHTHLSKNYGTTIGIVLLQFYDDSSYFIYKKKLSEFSKFQSAKNSIAFNFKGLQNNVEGLEYLISEPLVGGLTERNFEGPITQKYKKEYRLYFYCILDSSGNLKNLSGLFK